MRTVNYLDGTKTHLYKVRVTFHRQDLMEMPPGISRVTVEAEIEARHGEDIREVAQKYAALHTGGQWLDDAVSGIDIEVWAAGYLWVKLPPLG